MPPVFDAFPGKHKSLGNGRRRQHALRLCARHDIDAESGITAPEGDFDAFDTYAMSVSYHNRAFHACFRNSFELLIAAFFIEVSLSTTVPRRLIRSDMAPRCRRDDAE